VVQFINYQHVSIFYFGHHTNWRRCAGRAIPTKPTWYLDRFGRQFDNFGLDRRRNRRTFAH